MSYPVESLDEVERLDVPELLSKEPGLARVPAGPARDPRFDPSDGSSAVVTVVAAGPRSDLDAYRRAATRVGRRRRQSRS